jgi:carbon storage regulator
MLILSRKSGESIIIDGCILVKIVRIEGGMVKVGIDAPAEIPVHRQEVFDEIQRNNIEAITRSRSALPRINMPQASKGIALAAPAGASPGAVTPPSTSSGLKAESSLSRKSKNQTSRVLPRA